MFGGLNTNENHSFIAFGSQTGFSYFGYNGVLKARCLYARPTLSKKCFQCSQFSKIYKYSTCDDIGVKPDDTDCLVVPWDNKELDNCPVACR